MMTWRRASLRGHRHENPKLRVALLCFYHLCGTGSSETTVFLYVLSFHQFAIFTFTHLPSMLYSLHTDVVNKP